jgi:pilus assembly protein CpaD
MSQSSRFPQATKPVRAGLARSLPSSVAPAAAILLTVLLAGCQTDPVHVGAVPDDYRTNHPIIISERAQAVDIPVMSGQTRLTVAQKGLVDEALSRYRENGSGVLNVMVPTGSDNAFAARHVRDDIMRHLHQSGLSIYKMASETYPVPAGATAAPIRLTFSAMTASTNACGKWPDDMLNDTENKHWANFGCASQNNLAAQIANPADLLGPRAPGTINANKNDAVNKSYEDPTDNPPVGTQVWSPQTTY